MTTNKNPANRLTLHSSIVIESQKELLLSPVSNIHLGQETFRLQASILLMTDKIGCKAFSYKKITDPWQLRCLELTLQQQSEQFPAIRLIDHLFEAKSIKLGFGRETLLSFIGASSTTFSRRLKNKERLNRNFSFRTLALLQVGRELSMIIALILGHNFTDDPVDQVFLNAFTKNYHRKHYDHLVSVDDALSEIGLTLYTRNFKIKEQDDESVIKIFTTEETK